MISTAAATAAPITSTSWSGWARSSAAAHHGPGAEQARGRRRCRRRRAGGRRGRERGVDPVRRQHPERAAGDHQHQRRHRPEPPLHRDAEDRDPDAGDEQVADVGVDPGRGEVAPPVAAHRSDEPAEVVGLEALAAPGPAPGSPGSGWPRSPRRAARRAALARSLRPRRQRAAPALAAGLARASMLVAAALQLRRALAQPGAAVRALGHVGADLLAAAPADDAQLRRAHAARIPLACSAHRLSS